MKPPPRLPLLLLRRRRHRHRHFSSSSDDPAASSTDASTELVGVLAKAPSPDATRDLAALLRRLGGRGLASALSSLPAPLPVASALRILQHVLSPNASASLHGHGDDLLSPRVSALLLPSLIADRSTLPSARRLVSRLLHEHPLPVAAAAVADVA